MRVMRPAATYAIVSSQKAVDELTDHEQWPMRKEHDRNGLDTSHRGCSQEAQGAS